MTLDARSLGLKSGLPDRSFLCSECKVLETTGSETGLKSISGPGSSLSVLLTARRCHSSIARK
jgi:hypothetical protein